MQLLSYGYRLMTITGQHLVRNCSTVTMCRLKDCPVYLDMSTTLAETHQEDDNTSALDIASKFILKTNLVVNKKILDMHLVSRPKPHSSLRENFKEMETSGEIRSGHYTFKHDEIIRGNYNLLLTKTQLLEGNLNRELFVSSLTRDSQLKKNLVGFFLLQHLPNSQLRLPYEVCERLGKVLFSKNFSKTEDEFILSWVSQNGPRWTELAVLLGRNYIYSNSTVSKRHKYLAAKKNRYEAGELRPTELALIVEEVFKQDKNALDSEKRKVDWNSIALKLNRSDLTVRQAFHTKILPTLTLYEAGNLTDIRPTLIDHIQAEGWTYAAEVDWQKLAERKEFRGYTATALCKVYTTMKLNTAKKFPYLQPKTVMIDDVKKWWFTSTRKGRSGKLWKDELSIVSAYRQSQ